jgi:serine/threonine protein phosphatase PrpC
MSIDLYKSTGRNVNNSNHSPLIDDSDNFGNSAVSMANTISTLSPARSANGGVADILKSCFVGILDFFQSCLSCFGLFSNRAASNKTPEEIKDIETQWRLKNQMERAQKQMEKEENDPCKQKFTFVQEENIPGLSDGLFEEGKIGGLSYGAFWAQGGRKNMEDTHLAIEFDLAIGPKIHPTGASIGGRKLLGRKTYPIKLFGIFDGHRGGKASQYLHDHLQKVLSKTLVEFNPNGLTDAGIFAALKLTFVILDRDFRNANHPDRKTKKHGSTATVAMILDEKLWTANVGDSRTVLDNAGAAIQLSEDAKPNDPYYKRNIEKRGGQVYQAPHNVPRLVNVPIDQEFTKSKGGLSIARAIGGHHLGHALNPRPKITVKPLSEIQAGSHLILCCDGIYDVATTKQIVKNVHDNPSLIPRKHAKNIVYSAYHSGSRDNLSAMVVSL